MEALFTNPQLFLLKWAIFENLGARGFGLPTREGKIEGKDSGKWGVGIGSGGFGGTISRLLRTVERGKSVLWLAQWE
ncbi:hypothetical protein Nepgr_003156 [Nepenthes gracilis]|uniref:Uncharacterized protein n=1 Tax=Nepenthes gracilis TaxID=150966 RepID=A0AAD3XD27_NEPGR|nr:hypothetical protein Nepgr_003156 [Nepenthes gracilis]